MLKRLFSSLRANAAPAVPVTYAPSADTLGICYPLSLADNESAWPLAAYLEQLVEEDLAAELSDRWLISWDNLYDILEDPEHATSLPLLGLPSPSPLRPELGSQEGLASPDFRVFVDRWTDPATGAPVHSVRTGGFITAGDKLALLPQAVYRLTTAVQQFATTQQTAPGEATNQVGWASIRRLARAAGSGMDGFLDKTVVVKPDRLHLRLRKSATASTPTIEVEPGFDGQPENWLRSFDAHTEVKDQYRVPQPDGSLTHVLIQPDVKAVLQQVRALPGRRVAGDNALSFVRNPFTFLGDDAATVLNPEAHDEALVEAGIDFHRFEIRPHVSDDGQRIERVDLVLRSTASPEAAATILPLMQPAQFEAFLQELRLKVAAGMSAGFWEGYELNLADVTLDTLRGLENLLQRWKSDAAGAEFAAVLDLSQYGERVIGIGEAEHIASPFLIKDRSEDWLSNAASLLGHEPLAGTSAPSTAVDSHTIETLRQRIDECLAAGDATIAFPGNEAPMPVAEAQQWLERWEQQGNSVSSAPPAARDAGRAVLQIELNIEAADYTQSRAAALQAAHAAAPALPEALRPEIDLRDHQRKGVAWLQHMFGLSPGQVSGCLLADDMGLGKTLQLLTLIVAQIEQDPDTDPVLIVAPVSLLDNWERELQRFFYADALPTIKLYGPTLREAKFAPGDIPDELKARGIKNLLKPGWIGSAKIVLTTYETLRDQEFSLARQTWSIVVCDEAQKIKNPAAMITQSAKALRARFRIACTGTPVENTLIDLWSLFDFIQPGFLGSLNEFGKRFQRPIEAGVEKDETALAQLRTLIEPQTLRRTKADVAKDLPAKHVDNACRHLPMHTRQRQIYLDQIAAYLQQKAAADGDSGSTGMLGLLHRLKITCAHPPLVMQDPSLHDASPKMTWLLKTLTQIRDEHPDDKVIVFTELRDIQRELQHHIQTRFGFKPVIINGDTSTSSTSAGSRQRLIDQFQAKPGFGIIILSTVAVGFGVNVQAANHVVHFTRCWNPAKEDQATDRAYRIGQEKDVFVYYPTIRAGDLQTFEATLDDLLEKRRALAKDMLTASAELQAKDFAEVMAT